MNVAPATSSLSSSTSQMISSCRDEEVVAHVAMPPPHEKRTKYAPEPRRRRSSAARAGARAPLAAAAAREELSPVRTSSKVPLRERCVHGVLSGDGIGQLARRRRSRSAPPLRSSVVALFSVAGRGSRRRRVTSSATAAAIKTRDCLRGRRDDRGGERRRARIRGSTTRPRISASSRRVWKKLPRAPPRAAELAEMRGSLRGYRDAHLWRLRSPSPSWRALCARAKRRRAARTSSLKPSLAPLKKSVFRAVRPNPTAAVVLRRILLESPRWRRCGGFGAGLASIRPAIGFLRARAYPSTRVDDGERRRVCATHCVRPAAFRENPGSCNNGATALSCSLVPCSIWVADPISDFFLTAQLCRFQPEERRLFSNFSYPAVCHVVCF